MKNDNRPRDLMPELTPELKKIIFEMSRVSLKLREIGEKAKENAMHYAELKIIQSYQFVDNRIEDIIVWSPQFDKNLNIIDHSEGDY